MDLGTSDDNASLLQTEKQNLFDIIKDKDGKASVYTLEEFCDHLEKVVFTETNEIDFEEKLDEDYDLLDVSEQSYRFVC